MGLGQELGDELDEFGDEFDEFDDFGGHVLVCVARKGVRLMSLGLR